MTGTIFLTAAYHVRMEMLILLLLLSTLDKNNDLTAKLRGALNFYRENRELLQMMATMSAAPPSGTTPPPEQKPEQEKTSRHAEGSADSMKLFEEYLKRTAV